MRLPATWVITVSILPHAQDTAVANLNDACAKLDADGVRAVGHELLLGELVQQARLAHTHVPDNNKLPRQKQA